MLYGAMAALLVAMALVMWRIIAGPTQYDRILAANSFGTKTVLLIALAGVVFGPQDLVDIALAYALINLIATIALMKLFRYRTLQAPLSHVPELPEASAPGGADGR